MQSISTLEERIARDRFAKKESAGKKKQHRESPSLERSSTKSLSSYDDTELDVLQVTEHCSRLR